MPSLRLFGKPTMVAGDDLRMWTISNFLFRVVQFVMTMPIFVRYLKLNAFSAWPDIREECFEKQGIDDPSWIREDLHIVILIYLVLSLLIAILGMLWSLSTFYYSSQGTPTNTEPRERPLKVLCTCNYTVGFALKIVVAVFGSLSVISIIEWCECTQDHYEDEEVPTAFFVGEIFNGKSEVRTVCGNRASLTSLYIGLAVTHLIDLISATAIALYFSQQWIPWRRWIDQYTFFDKQARWACFGRCCFVNISMLTCCLNGGIQASFKGDLSDFGTIMAHYFDFDQILDVTLSDSIAALVMLKRVHLAQELYSKEKLIQQALGDAERGLDSESSSADEIGNNDQDRRKLRRDLLKSMAKSSKKLSKAGAKQESTRAIHKVMQTWTTGKSVTYQSKEDPKLGRLENKIFRRSALRQTVVVPRLRDAVNYQRDSERLSLAEGARFIHYAEAIYFWATYKGGKHCSDYFFHRLQRMGKAKDMIWNTSLRLLKLARVPCVRAEDIKYLQFKESLNSTPFAVVVDHEWKSVVVSIRGTVSLEDLLTDVTLSPKELSAHGEQYGFDGNQRFCHRGVLSRVERIYADIKANVNLNELLQNAWIENPEQKSKDLYALRITGHSLGAACAAILTLFLRNEFPFVRCSAFSPPGCSVCAMLSHEMRDYVTSYILDSDVIGRASLDGFLGLRDEMLQLVARIKIPKYQVLRSKKNDMTLEEANDQVLCTVSELDHTNKYVESLDRFFEQDYAKHENSERLFPPGRIMQMFRTVNLPRWQKEEDDTEDAPYGARWAEKEDFGRVVMSDHFVSDHETTNVKDQLHLLASIAGLQEPFTSALSKSHRSSLTQMEEAVKEHDALEESEHNVIFYDAEEIEDDVQERKVAFADASQEETASADESDDYCIIS